MFTRCPECHTAFRVTVAQLKARDGLVRCGRCNAVFRADLRLFAAPGGGEPAEEAPTEEIQRTEEIRTETRAKKSKRGKRTADAQADIPVITDLSLFLPPRRRLVHPLLWTGGILLTALVLLGQFIYFYRNELAQVPQLEPVVAELCRVLECDIVSLERHATLELVETTIAPHPRYANVLRIRASLVNRNDQAQPLPLMQVSLTASDGQLLARRVFGARDYLATPAAAALPMSPNVAVNALLDVTNPDNKATGYEIKLFPPE